MWEIEKNPLLSCNGRIMFILRLVNRIVVQRAILKQEVFITSVDFNSTHRGTSRWIDRRVFYKWRVLYKTSVGGSKLRVCSVSCCSYCMFFRFEILSTLRAWKQVLFESKKVRRENLILNFLMTWMRSNFCDPDTIEMFLWSTSSNRRSIVVETSATCVSKF